MHSDLKPSILLVDDQAENLDSLSKKLADALGDSDVGIRTWLPDDTGMDLFEAFKSKADDQTILVVTDYDLTMMVRGFFGGSVVEWSQQRSIPAGDFSRRHMHMLPAEPKLFELRVPTSDDLAATFIANVSKGFLKIRSSIKASYTDENVKRGLGAMLAMILERPHLESQFSAYMSRIGSANSALFQLLSAEVRVGDPGARPAVDDKVRLVTYVLGHVMFNSVLKFPGPILSAQSLCAYVGTSNEESDAVCDQFAKARYDGPFSNADRFFWRETVDEILDAATGKLEEATFDDFGDYNRAIVQQMLDRELASHTCAREKCNGRKGGFWCPFTLRPVCVREDCSVPSSSWIPDGAQLTRVERDFYDEWAPLLVL
jgi:hypothetical protein